MTNEFQTLVLGLIWLYTPNLENPQPTSSQTTVKSHHSFSCFVDFYLALLNKQSFPTKHNQNIYIGIYFTEFFKDTSPIESPVSIFEDFLKNFAIV